MNDKGSIRQAVRTTTFDEALAAHLGLNPTDMRCLEVVIEHPGLTPGRLAELSGLTTGAITGVLDRLERSGFVERRPDPGDRRSVTVRPIAAGAARAREVMAPLEAAIDAALGRYSAGERAAIDGFLADAGRIVGEQTARLKAETRGGFVGSSFSAPLAGATRGRLEFVSGAPRLALNFASLGPRANARMIMETSASRLAFAGPAPAGELVRATFKGPLPDVRSSGGVVKVRYRRQAMSAFSSRGASVALSDAIPWTIELMGGITDLTGTLEELALERMDVQGGANHIVLDLPAPSGTVLVRVAGVASSARFRRPAVIPVSLRVAGGVSHLRLDDQRHEQVAGDRQFVGDGFADRPDRYELEILGGAGDIRVGAA